MTDLFEGGELFADADARTVKGLLFPFNEVSRQSTTSDPISWIPGAIKLPADVSVVSANVLHSQFHPVGRATSLTETAEGIVAEFSIAKTEDGDFLLAEIAAGRLRKLSGEVRNIVRDAADKTKGLSAMLTGAAFVPNGAFESAALFAALEAEEAEDKPQTDLHIAYDTSEFKAAIRAVIAEIQTEQTAEESSDSEETDPTEPIEEEEEEIMADATVPNTVAAESATGQDTSKSGLFALINNARNMDPESIKALADAQNAGVFALSDIPYTAGANARVPAWLGEIWQGRSFERKVIPVVTNGTLTSMSEKGYVWGNKPVVTQYAGNKAAVASNTVSLTPKSYDAIRFAGAWDIDRAYYDFNDQDFLNGFFAHMVNSYAQVTDQYALDTIVAASTKVNAETFPTGVGSAMGKVVQGALAVIAAGGTPTSALVATDVYKQLLFTRQEDRLAFLGAAVGLEAGSVESFRVIPHGSIQAGGALVLDRQAVEFKELSGGIRVNALDIARGGVDEAVYGYALTKVILPSAVVLVDDAV